MAFSMCMLILICAIHALSEDDWELPVDVMTEAEALKEYVITNGEMLESSPDGYQPKLDVLDAAIQSLRVEAGVELLRFLV